MASALVPALRREALLRRTVALSMSVTTVAAIVALAAGASRVSSTPVALWQFAGGQHFSMLLQPDLPALIFALFIAAICGVVAAFSVRYLHREPGFYRYFLFFGLFVHGMMLVSLAGSVETLLVGWELIGLSSAMLVGFFHERPEPVESALFVYAAYRIGDAAMLAAAMLLHHWGGSGALATLFQGELSVVLSAWQLLCIGLLLLTAAAAKGALLPFSGWLPRAMEGPTPSSAVYYGALSVHAGCYLLWRAEPLLATSPVARSLALATGLLTALYGTIVMRAQTDIKTRIAYASLSQTGLIVAEIALGWTTLAFVHMLGHICVRLLELLAAPNVLHEHHAIENRRHGRGVTAHVRRRSDLPGWLYTFALERGYLDVVIARCIVGPILRLARMLDALDRRLSGSAHSRGAS
ncbi:MAG: oxidoreductase [Candidatus Dadabacteria bacterium]|nr:MAG: oxidoreductase [Candidatus Dadabacteria bacterium]